MLEGFNWILFVFANVTTAVVGSCLSVWQWLPSEAPPSRQHTSRVLTGRLFIAAATAVAWSEFCIGSLPDRIQRSFYFGLPAARFLILTGFVSAAACAILAWAVLPGSDREDVAVRKVRRASITLLIINGLAGALYLISRHWE